VSSDDDFQPDLGSLYGDCRRRILDLVSDLTHVEAATGVPACPLWSVHDVVAHLTGVTADALSGNMGGAPSAEWTARHVEKRRDLTIEAIVHEWDANAAQFEQAIASTRSGPAVADVASHEQDIRGALGVPGHRDNDAIAWCGTWMVPGLGGKITLAGLPAVRLRTETQDTVLGDGDPATTLELSDFDLFRAFFGRRSRAQIESYFTDGSGAPYVEYLRVFGPADAAVIE
jgi:uncharacterized protein (TIGR03083 family)